MIAQLRLSSAGVYNDDDDDHWRNSRSARRSDPDNGEPLSVNRVDAVRYAVQLGDGDAHVVTLFTVGWKCYADCTCDARCQDCAHVLAMLRRDHGEEIANNPEIEVNV